ncbi:hypothetical protein [Microbacterium sp. KNMS]
MESELISTRHASPEPSRPRAWPVPSIAASAGRVRPVISVVALLCAGATVIGCAPRTAPVAEESTDAAPEQSGAAEPAQGGSAESAQGSSADGLVPVGFPDGFDCASIEGLIEPFSAGLYLNTSRTEGESEIACAWSDIPLDTLFPQLDDLSTELDVIVHVDFEKNAAPERIANYCAGPGLSTTADALAVFEPEGGCGGGSLLGDTRYNGVWASVPYFDLQLKTSCDISTECTPVLPSSFTDQAAYDALHAIAAELAARVEFAEPVVVSEADSGPEFLRDWGEAGFPSYATESAWYCDGNISSSDLDVAIESLASQDGWSWEVREEPVEEDAAIPDFYVVFTGPGDGEWAAYRVGVVNKRCVFSIEMQG